MPADVSAVKQESNILKDCKIHFINYGNHSKQEMEALVRKLGGTVSNCGIRCCINYSCIDHCINYSIIYSISAAPTPALIASSTIETAAFSTDPHSFISVRYRA